MNYCLTVYFFLKGILLYESMLRKALPLRAGLLQAALYHGFKDLEVEGDFNIPFISFSN